MSLGVLLNVAVVDAEVVDEGNAEELGEVDTVAVDESDDESVPLFDALGEEMPDML